MNNQNFETWKQKDKLGISEKVSGFAQIIRHTEGTAVYSVTAPFGIGKSFFCEGLKACLDNHGIPCICYNVWEVDFYPHPLMPLICEISEKLNTIYKTQDNGSALERFTAAAEKVLAATTIRLPGLSFNCGTLLQNADEKQIYEEYQKYRAAVAEFQTVLKEIAAHNRPLVIIIDELDRCRPDYAVELLETVKHLFEIPGVVFVLSIDENQLQNSVKQLYGPINFSEYMRKFVTYSFALPKPDPERYVLYLSEKYGLEPLLRRFPEVEHSLQRNRDSRSVAQIINILFAAYSCLFNFSLRAQNQVMQRLILFLQSLDANKAFYPEFAVFLACVREYGKGLYEDLKNNYRGGNTIHHIREHIGTDATFDHEKFEQLMKQVRTKYFSHGTEASEFNSCDVFMQAMENFDSSSLSDIQTYASWLKLYDKENHPRRYFEKMDFIDTFLAPPNPEETAAAE